MLELSQSTSIESTEYILSTPIQSKRRRRRHKKKQNLPYNKDDIMPPPPYVGDKNENEQPDADRQPSPPTHKPHDSRPTTPFSKGIRPSFSGSCTPEQSYRSEGTDMHDYSTSIPQNHASDNLPVTPTTNLTSIIHNQITLIVPPMLCPVIPFAVSPSQIGTPPAPAQLTELLPPTRIYS